MGYVGVVSDEAGGGGGRNVKIKYSPSTLAPCCVDEVCVYVCVNVCVCVWGGWGWGGTY